MNNSYKNAMDKIVLSDEKKEKIIKTALLKKQSKKHFYNKYAINIAAGIVICIVSIPVTGIFINPIPDYIPAVTASPSPSELPVSSYPHFLETQNHEKETENAKPSENNGNTQLKNSHNSNNNTENNNPKKDSIKANENGQEKYTVHSEKKNQYLSVTDSPEISDTHGLSDDTENYDAFPANTVPFSLKAEADEETESTAAAGRRSMLRSAYSYQKFDNTEELIKNASFELSVPEINGFTIKEAGILSESTAQIIYSDGSSLLVYRTCEGNDDCSGNYNKYENTENIVCDDKNITFKTDSVFGTLMLWNSDEMSFSVQTDNVLQKDEASDIVSEI